MRKPKNWFNRKAMKEELKDEKIEQTEAKNEQEVAIEIEATEETNSEEQGTDNQEVEAASLEEAMEIIAKLQVELRDTKKQLESEKESVLRLNADFVNLRNRQRKEMADTVRFASQDLLLQLLPILDDFDRTLKAMEKTDNLSAVQKGIELVSNSMKKRFAKVGLEPIDTMGKEFDSELHEAITTVPVEAEEQKGKVIDEVEKGYKLKDRVIRFSKVVVGE